MANKSHKTFMPFLCRFTKNDTVQPAKLTVSNSTDPFSPKLTCIGQMKKKSTATVNNRFLAGTISVSGNVKSSVNSNRYKLFSGKHLIYPAIDTVSIKNSNSNTNRSKSCNGRRRTAIRSEKYYMTSSDDDIVRVVVVEDLDPPLPVVKCRRRDRESNGNLLKRRGIEMKTLEIQPIQLSVNRVSGFSVSTSATSF